MPWASKVEAALASQPMATSPVWTDLTAYVEPPISITVGRGDEFSEVQPSTMSLRLRNYDGRFTMGNTAGAYWPNIKPGRRIRHTVAYTPKNWCPNPTFDVDITGWSAGGSVPPTLARVTTPVHSGAGAMRITWGTGGVFPQAAATLDHCRIGETYTYSAWLRVPAGSPACKLGVGGIGFGSPTTVNDVYQQRTITFTATSTVHSIQVHPDSAPTSGQICYVDDVQPELGPVPTAFDGTPPVVYSRFDGHVNGWPTMWDAPGGSLAMCAISATDRMKRFGQVGELRSMVAEEILRDEVSTANTGMAYYPLSEPVGAITASNSSRRVFGNGAVRTFSGTPGGTIDFGAGTGPGTDALPAVMFNPVSSIVGQYLEIPLLLPVGFYGITLECFIRCTSIVSRWIAVLLDSVDNAVALSVNSAGQLRAQSYQGGTQMFTCNSTTVVNDNATHHVAVTESLSGTTVTVRLYLDGVQVATTTYTWTALMAGTRLLLGGWPDSLNGLYEGTMSHVAAHSATLAAGRIADHANAGLNGLAGERTDQRIGRIADWIGIPTADRAFDTGDSTVGAQSTSGKQPLQVMGEVVATESGVLFESGASLLTFHNRSRRYNQTPVFTLPAGQISDNASFPGDDFGMVNDMAVTRAGAATARAVDQTSIDEYGLYRNSAEIVPATDDAAQAAADWRTGIYGTPRVRIPNVTVEVAKLELYDPSLVPGVLAATIGTKMRLGPLPATAPASTVDVFVEGWTEQIDVPTWQISFNCSPGDIADVWQLGVAGHSELGDTTRLAQ